MGRKHIKAVRNDRLRRLDLLKCISCVGIRQDKYASSYCAIINLIIDASFQLSDSSFVAVPSYSALHRLFLSQEMLLQGHGLEKIFCSPYVQYLKCDIARSEASTYSKLAFLNMLRFWFWLSHVTK